MSKYTSDRSIFSTRPLFNSDNRKENILVEARGIIYPSCIKIIYGILLSKYASQFKGLMNRAMFNVDELYYNYAYFDDIDLLHQLYYIDYDKEKDPRLSDEFIKEVMDVIHDTYQYTICPETTMRHALIETLQMDFVETLTIVFDHPVREIDLKYLHAIIPNDFSIKIVLVCGTMKDVILDNKGKDRNEFFYSTIVMNDLELINEMVDNVDTYNIDRSLILLRNHSGNVEFKIIRKEDGTQDIIFSETGSKELYGKLVYEDQHVPKSGIRFGRFEPYLFKDSLKELSKNDDTVKF